MPVISKTKQEVFIFLIICIVVLAFYPNIHVSLLLSFVWMLFFVYKYGHNIISKYLDNGISEIKTSLEKLTNEKNKLRKNIEVLKDEISSSEKNYEIAITDAKVEAQDHYNKKMLEIDSTIKEIEIKNKSVLLSIESEYSELIKRKITDLIIDNLMNKINDTTNVRNVTLAGITRAITELQNIRTEEIKK